MQELPCRDSVADVNISVVQPVGAQVPLRGVASEQGGIVMAGGSNYTPYTLPGFHRAFGLRQVCWNTNRGPRKDSLGIWEERCIGCDASPTHTLADEAGGLYPR
jgi:hypothetical protein